MNKILIICYTFPPAPGIGGRRWAKFAKYLSKEGYILHIACAANIHDQKSDWLKDVENNENINVHPFTFKYQKLFSFPGNLLQRVLRKIICLALRRTKYSETFITSLPNRPIWNNMENLIRTKKINTVIVSGDPFLFYQASLLKKQIPFKLILDYRDLWNDHSFYSKFSNLTSKQKQYFEFAENTAINNCDKVVAVDEHLKKVLSSRINKNSSKIEVIHNGFDSDDFKTILPFPSINNEILKLYFAGNIASDLNEIVIHFIESFKELKKNNPVLYFQTEIRITGQMDKSLFDRLLKFELENLHLSTHSISMENYLAQLQSSQAGIVILSEEYANSFITKFTDYLYLKKFIVALGYEGDFSSFLSENNCGLTFTLKDNYKFFIKVHEKIKIPFTLKDELTHSFDIKNLTQQYIHVLND